jgi:ankyrin repeat protein
MVDRLNLSLWGACMAGDAERTLLLLEEKADVNAKVDGTKILVAAVSGGDPDLLGLLLRQKGIEVNIADGEMEWTPLHYAAVMSRNLVEPLLCARADICMDRNGDNVLHITDKEDVVDAVVRHWGIDCLYQQNRRGEYPIDCASGDEWSHMVRVMTVCLDLFNSF